YPQFAAEVAAASQCELGHSTAETLVCAGDRADLRNLQELVKLQHEAGFDTALITSSQARDLEPSLSPGISGAVRIPKDHSIDPRRLCAALMQLFAEDLEQQSVSALLRSGDRTHGVRLADGR